MGSGGSPWILHEAGSSTWPALSLRIQWHDLSTSARPPGPPQACASIPCGKICYQDPHAFPPWHKRNMIMSRLQKTNGPKSLRAPRHCADDGRKARHSFRLAGPAWRGIRIAPNIPRHAIRLAMIPIRTRMAVSPKPQDHPSRELERLSGLVERVTFHNADSGFCVLRLKVQGARELVTLVGHTPSVTPGEYAGATGTWVTDREHGRQFKAVFVSISPPNTLTGIERYLGSGMVKGIGPVYASRLVEAFGTKVFDTIERTPERLREIDGIGE